MAAVTRSVVVAAAAADVWEAVADVGALHTKLVPAVVADTQLEEDGAVRVVTFRSGAVLRELIVSNDADARRLAWSAEGDQWTHHNASLTVAEGPNRGCVVTWTADFLPHSAAPLFEQFLEGGLAALRANFDD